MAKSEVSPEALVLQVAQAVLDGKTGVIEGCRQLTRFTSKLSAQDAELLAPIIAVESETDDVVLGESRSLWLPEAAERKDREINRYLDQVQGVVLGICQALVQKYAYLATAGDPPEVTP